MLSSLFSSGAASVIGAVGDAIDKNVTSDKERGEIKGALAVSLQNFQLSMEREATAQEAEISKRWTADAAGDSWLAKNIRPLALGYTFALLTAAGGFALAGKHLPDAWLSLLSTIAVTIIVAYFGGRTAEKGIKQWRGQ
jgi:hypothetical protein